MDKDGNSLNIESIPDGDEDDCMVCLESSTDSAPLMTPSSFFVSDCRCKYLAHERCMTEWVMKQADNSKRLSCPYCNSNVALAFDYGLLLTPRDVRIDMHMTGPPASRTQKICESNKYSIMCRCFCCVSFLIFIVFVYILM